MDISVVLVQLHLKLLSSRDDMWLGLSPQTGTDWKCLKDAANAIWRGLTEAFILSPAKKRGWGEPTKKKKRTQCNFYFLNVDCKRSENACDVNKTGAKCSINFQKQRLWSWAWKTKEQMYMIWNLCLFGFIKVCGRKLQNTATDAHVKRRPSLWPSRTAYQ